MPKFIDLLQKATASVLWLDDTDYSERLLAGGQTPWHDAAQYLAFRRKAVGLLRPDVVSVPLGRFMAAAVAARGDLKEAMAGKRRAVVPARTLLADETLRAELIETIQALRAGFAAPPLVLALPSPRALVRFAYGLAFGPDAEVEVGADEADSCAVYVAEFLRSFGESGVDAVLLEEDADAQPASEEEIGWYQPILNLAAHYRWDIGLKLPAAASFEGQAGAVQFVIAPQALAGAAHGQDLGAAFWTGQAPAAPAPGGFRFASVPPSAVPEEVLERLATLKGG